MAYPGSYPPLWPTANVSRIADVRVSLVTAPRWTATLPEPVRDR